MKINKKKIFGWLKVIIIFYCAVGITLYYAQTKFLFHPEPLSNAYVFNFKMPFKEINIPVNKEDTINLIQFFPKDSIRKGVVLYFHGNMENVEHYAAFVPNFTKSGYEVWIEDYPGYGKSRGEISEKKLYQQSLLVYKLAAASYRADSIIIYGKSLGTGIAAYLASETACKELILETPYYSIPALFGQYAFIYPTQSMSKYKIPTYSFLEDLKKPVVIFHGNNDRVIPYSCAERLKPFLKPTDQFITIDKAGHNNINDFEIYHHVLDSLLQ